MTSPCWIARREADPRFDYAEDTFAPPPGTWAPDCGHAACAEDERACTAEGGCHDWDCPVATCRWDTAGAMCVLDEGHAGEHRFVSENEIVLEFPSAAPLPRAGATP